jgi:hypothetical protein
VHQKPFSRKKAQKAENEFYGQRVAGDASTNMIRITAQQESTLTRLFLEGKLSGACVEELDKCWQMCPSTQVALLVDLTNVSFVDEHGKQLLARMHNKGIKLFSKSLMTKCLIEEIENSATISGDQISSSDQLLSPHNSISSKTS